MGRIISAITKDKTVRIYVADTTDMVELARQWHNSTPVSTAALGRVITATSIMGRMLKNENEKLTVQIKGDSDIKTITAVGNYSGDVKAYISNPDVVRPAKANGKIDVGGAIGKGEVVVIRDLGLKNPFVGKSELVSGEIAEDLAHYYMYSEQQPSVVSLGVLMDVEKAGVKASGGIIIQPLPFADEEVIQKIEKSVSDLKPISTLIDEGNTLEQITQIALSEFEIEIISDKDIKLYCDCSRERIESALVSIGKDEIKDILENDKSAELVCHFCNKKYRLDESDLIKILDSFEDK